MVHPRTTVPLYVLPSGYCLLPAEVNALRVLFFGMEGLFSRAPLAALLEAEFEVCAVVVPRPARVTNDSAAVRTVIRKHAIRDVAAAQKRSNTYGKHNMRQLPVFVDDNMQTNVKQVPAESEVFVERLPLRSSSGSFSKPASTPPELALFAGKQGALEISELQEYRYPSPPSVECGVLVRYPSTVGIVFHVLYGLVLTSGLGKL